MTKDKKMSSYLVLIHTAQLSRPPPGGIESGERSIRNVQKNKSYKTSGASNIHEVNCSPNDKVLVGRHADYSCRFIQHFHSCRDTM